MKPSEQILKESEIPYIPRLNSEVYVQLPKTQYERYAKDNIAMDFIRQNIGLDATLFKKRVKEMMREL